MMPAPNATCDIYRFTNGTNTPDVAGVACRVQADFMRGLRGGDRGNNSLCWTHVLLLALAVDVRDCYGGANTSNSQGDFIYFGPRATATQYRVIFIEKVDDYKRVYIERQVPNWPTNDL